jgi:hypothetical protein
MLFGIFLFAISQLILLEFTSNKFNLWGGFKDAKTLYERRNGRNLVGGK